MIYDFSQPIFNKVPQWPAFRPTTMTIPHLTAIESANVERLEMITHTARHVDAPFHLFPDEDIRVPEAMLDGRSRHSALSSVLVHGTGGAWTRAVAWDEREMA
ncbi:cyclase family protein [Acidobacterium sp. S8]|uniref:cyclase family protein n=1 Tax=Acidobacterium sp. S8 TaxID=1641854 RepID=UPI00131AF930|nr:cyclase family protein [Acidobacterium sp. S8]